MSHKDYGSFGSPFYFGGKYGYGYYDRFSNPTTIVQTISDFYPTWMKPDFDTYRSWPMPKELVYDLAYGTDLSYNVYWGRIGEPFYSDDPREAFNYYKRLTYYQWITSTSFLYVDNTRRFNVIIGYNTLSRVFGNGNIHVGRNANVYRILDTSYSVNLGNDIDPIEDVFTLKTNPNHGILTISPPKKRNEVYKIDAYKDNTFIYSNVVNDWSDVNLVYNTYESNVLNLTEEIQNSDIYQNNLNETIIDSDIYQNNLNESITNSNIRIHSTTKNISSSNIKIDTTDIYQKNLNESITSSNIRINSTTQNISTCNITLTGTDEYVIESDIYQKLVNESITDSDIRINSTTQNISSCTILLSSSTFDVIDSNIDIKTSSNLEITLNSNLQLENTNAKLNNMTVALGTSALSDRDGMYSVMHKGFETAGDAQRSQFLLFGSTDSSTLTEIFCDGTNGSKRMTIPNNKVWSGVVNILGTQDDGNYVARFLRQVTIKNDNGTVSLVNSVITLGTDESPSLSIGNFTAIEITADNSNNSLKIRCRGLSDNWRWIASAEGIELTMGA